jgi:FkbH-like protein
MVRVDCAGSLNQYLLKIRFKRWGMLWARGNFQLHPVKRAERIEQADYRIGTALQHLPLPGKLRRAATGKQYALKKRLASRGVPAGQAPTSFVLECYNPGSESVQLSLRIRSLHSSYPFPNLVQLLPGFRQARELTEAKIPFEMLIDAPPGFHRTKIPFAHIAPTVDLQSPFRIDITPNEVEDGATLYFGTIDFVYELPETVPDSKMIKCVVWDLDNTLWSGILMEDGIENLHLKPGIAGVIRELDRRGILQSVASKNNAGDALDAMRKFKLDTYFLYPQISWQPKSEAIRAIAQALNIGIDSLLFVDDSEFELQEVMAACQGVRSLNAELYLTLPDLDECRVPITAESGLRRQMYQVEEVRHTMAQDFGADYVAFLRHSEIKLEIRTLSDENLERVHELTQRTNQMNFSGNRYDCNVLKQILSNPNLDTYVLEVEDRYGTYGVVGFCIVDSRVPLMTDLMFSCRIQSKRVEHAFMAYLIREYIAKTGCDFQANYRKTARNAASGKVFADIGMQEIENKEGVSRLILYRDKVVADDGVVTIALQEPSKRL